jgi:uncharacterized protein (TIGR02453 family)
LDAAAEFKGFGAQALPFLKALGFHQTKEWFAENRAIYESEIRVPMGDLIEDLTARFEKLKVPLKGTRAASMFRVNKDVRFSKDKAPYNTHASAVLTRSGGKKDQGGAYIHIKPGECYIGAGIWYAEPEEFRAFRDAIISRTEEFRSLELAIKAKGHTFATDDELKRVPTDFRDLTDEDQRRWMRMKHFFVNVQIADDEITTPVLADKIVTLAQTMVPIMDFAWRAMDPVTALKVQPSLQNPDSKSDF